MLISVSKNNLTSHSFFSEKVISLLTIDGKKIKACKLYSASLELLKMKFIHQSTKTMEIASISHIVEVAIQHCMPNVEVRKVRVAGTTYLVPSIIPKKKQEAIAIRWIIEAAKKKKKSTKLSFAQCLADELFDAFYKQGYARTKRNELHRLAEANRAYIRYRWW